MSRNRPDVVRLSGPGDLVATIPHLFGFVPTESVVLLGLHGPRKRINLTLRLDLCPPEHDQVVAEDLARRVRCSEPDAVQIVVLTEAADDGGLPRRALASELGVAVRLPVMDALLVRAGRWWSYLCQDPTCCPESGTPVNPESDGATAMAAAHAMLGRSVLPDRDAVVRSVAAPRGIAAVSAEQALTRACDRVHCAGTGDWKAEALSLVRDLVERYADPRVAVRADDAALIVLACHDIATRDEILGMELDDEAEDQLLRLMRDCVRRALPPFDAPVCATYAWLAYAAGEGVLASAAVDRAIATDPSLSLARLIEDAITHGCCGRRRAGRPANPPPPERSAAAGDGSRWTSTGPGRR
jgi:hypothetical protein